MDSKKYKTLFGDLLEDYLEVKKQSAQLGYSETSFNFKDYLSTFNKVYDNTPKK